MSSLQTSVNKALVFRGMFIASSAASVISIAVFAYAYLYNSHTSYPALAIAAGLAALAVFATRKSKTILEVEVKQKLSQQLQDWVQKNSNPVAEAMNEQVKDVASMNDLARLFQQAAIAHKEPQKMNS